MKTVKFYGVLALIALILLCGFQVKQSCDDARYIRKTAAQPIPMNRYPTTQEIERDKDLMRKADRIGGKGE